MPRVKHEELTTWNGSPSSSCVHFSMIYIAFQVYMQTTIETNVQKM